MLEIKNIFKSYGKKRVLNDVSFSVEKGGVCGLLGLNGAGKSTLMKIICSLAFADAGSVSLNGKVINGKNSVPNENTGFMIEAPSFYRELTGRQNLTALSKLYDGVDKKRIDDVLTATGLAGQADVAFRKYSTGMKQRLYFSYAIMNNPRLLVLDEPFNGIDPVTLNLFRLLIKSFARSGCIVLLSSHILSEIQSVCDSIQIINRGEIVYSSKDIAGLDLESIFFSSVSGGGEAQ